MFEKHLGIDLGTVYVLTDVRSRGIALQELSALALSVNTLDQVQVAG